MDDKILSNEDGSSEEKVEEKEQSQLNNINEQSYIYFKKSIKGRWRARA